MRLVKASLVAAIMTLLATGALPARIEAQPSVGQVSFATLLSALDDLRAQTDALNNLLRKSAVAAEGVRLVNVQSLPGDADPQALKTALNRNNVEILALRRVLSDHEVMRSALANNSVAVSQVVAVVVASGGDVVLFYQPRQ